VLGRDDAMQRIMVKLVLDTIEIELFKNYTAITSVNQETFSTILELQNTVASVIVIRKKHGISYRWLT
jgi:hypothetical protein